jgi:hypothetical protein
MTAGRRRAAETRIQTASLLAAAILAASALGSCGGSSSSTQATVTATLGAPSRALPVGLLGIDGEAVTAPGRVWSRPRFAGSVAGLAPQAVRVFGGTIANYWDWRAGTFVRSPALPAAFRALRPRVSVTLADWARVVRAARAIPVYDLNLVTSTLAEQLAMLHAAQRLGLPVTRIELGNALYLAAYARRFPSGAAYGRIASRWIAALHRAFPGVQVAADAFAGLDSNAVALTPRVRDWNAGLLTTLRGESALSFHTYFDSGLPAGVAPRAAGAASTMLSAPARCWSQFQQLLTRLEAGVGAWVTEWSLLDRSARVLGTWAQGLDVASYGLYLVGEARVVQTDNEALVGSVPFAAIFAGRRGLDPGPGARLAVPAGRAPPTTPFALSASGSAMYDMLRVLAGAHITLPMRFSGGDSVRNGALQGIGLDANDGVHALVVNLGPKPIELRLPAQLSGLHYHELWDPPAALIRGPGSLQQDAGSTSTGEVRLDPYSLTRIVRG